MGKSVQITITNLEDAKTRLDKNVKDLDALLVRVKKLPFYADSKSTGISARQMQAITQTQMVSMVCEMKNLVMKTSELLDDAKKKYAFMDNSIAKELKNK